MDKKTLDERVKRLRQVDKIIKSLDPAIRDSSFKLLQSYITGGKTIIPQVNDVDKIIVDTKSKEAFFTSLDHDKPSDNVLSIMAYYYSQFGTSAISIDEIKHLADDVGITLPARVDMTLKTSQRDGKNLFTGAGRSKYRPTVHGEKFFKDTYNVKKGINKKV